ncbi:uncharacterized protein LOC135950390 [Calliphora vicina]|uniref:uncharacterized protein LOC135950390 n=1 Tax=Calliphora vicina TaxID=7373 RepID=UPI00325BBA04
MELHCFSDASNAAYAAVVYSRVISSDGIFVNILQSKSKVSPVKTVSIRRLELCAARLLVQLAQSVKESLCDVNIDNIYYWSDCSTVLSWIQKHPSCWIVYVANRVADIQRLSNPRQWNYVQSALNPADCASRGVLAQDLIKDQTWTNVLKASEINETLLRLIRLTQFIDFPNELKLLYENLEIRHSPLLKLMPFLDENGIIRVGGRLQNSDLSYNVKHPIILAKSYPLSKLIIIDSHERTLHGGVTLTMSVVNRKFWIVSGNQLAKSIIHKCIQCFRYSAKTSQQVMGNLPYVRLNVTRPFKYSGVDYTGPIDIKNSTLRSAVVSKGYICLFVCKVTKAVHLEAVSDLSTNSFLAAFRRFVSRRGACTDICSDCGTNFVGASKELKILYNRNSKSLPDDLRQALSLNCTNWHFIPPASPNFGGLWEAGVKSVKHHLKRITHNRLLSFEELATLLCQIVGCINSRPLCPLSSDPCDFDALTPAHFLVGEPIQCIQEESLLDQNINHLTRWKSIELLKQHFWKRWHREYLNRLQARPKWLKSKAKPKIGDSVLIADERCGPGQWLLGRIHDVHPGA